jgi:hypothetical protein
VTLVAKQLIKKPGKKKQERGKGKNMSRRGSDADEETGTEGEDDEERRDEMHFKGFHSSKKAQRLRGKYGIVLARGR